MSDKSTVAPPKVDEAQPVRCPRCTKAAHGGPCDVDEIAQKVAAEIGNKAFGTDPLREIDFYCKELAERIISTAYAPLVKAHLKIMDINANDPLAAAKMKSISAEALSNYILKG